LEGGRVVVRREKDLLTIIPLKTHLNIKSILNCYTTVITYLKNYDDNDAEFLE
jgi:hypothetical protein